MSQFDKEKIKDVFKEIKPVFNEMLGKYTHQRISGEWHFHGLAFVKEEMTYVFGLNLGFFKKTKINGFDSVGMNVLVRTNGINETLREKYASFFRENLKTWYTKEDEYSSFRGGSGSEFTRYKKLDEFKDIKEIVDFLTESIDSLNKIYPEIIKNPDNIFDEVLRAAYPWHDSIIDICTEISENK